MLFNASLWWGKSGFGICVCQRCNGLWKRAARQARSRVRNFEVFVAIIVLNLLDHAPLMPHAHYTGRRNHRLFFSWRFPVLHKSRRETEKTKKDERHGSLSLLGSAALVLGLAKVPWDVPRTKQVSMTISSHGLRKASKQQSPPMSDEHTCT